MIQRKIISQRIREFEIEEFVASRLKGVGHSSTKLQMTPLGEKIIINASRPGLVVGRRGQSIKKLTNLLKRKFGLENPQIEINEVENVNLDAQIVAERIANSLERFGVSRFKGVGHKTMEDVMNAGAYGVEILISGRVPSSRARRWRFYQGYLKKCGDLAVSGVKKAYATALLKTGTVGIQVRIMPPDIKLPDDIKVGKEKQTIVEELDNSTEESKPLDEEAERNAEKEGQKGKAEKKEAKAGKKAKQE